MLGLHGRSHLVSPSDLVEKIRHGEEGKAVPDTKDAESSKKVEKKIKETLRRSF